MADLAEIIVRALEGSDTKSTAALRLAAYKAIEPFIDLPKLLSETRAALAAEAEARADRFDSNERRWRDFAGRIPQLQAAVDADRRMAEEIRKALANDWNVDDITAKLGTTRAFIRTVRDLDYARKCKSRLKEAPRNKARERLERILARKPWGGEPTRERNRQAGGEKAEEIKVGPDMKAHRFLWPVDMIKGMLSPDQYAAALAMRNAYDTLTGSSKVANFDGGGGGNPANKTALTPEQQQAGALFKVFEKGLGKGSLAFAVATNFILGEPIQGNIKALSFVEWGRRYAGISGEHQARGVVQGLLWMVCADLAQIARLHEQYMVRERRAVLRAIRDKPHVSALIRRWAAEEAIQTLCREIPVHNTIIRATVNRLIREARNEIARQQQANRQAASSAA